MMYLDLPYGGYFYSWWRCSSIFRWFWGTWFLIMFISRLVVIMLVLHLDPCLPQDLLHGLVIELWLIIPLYWVIVPCPWSLPLVIEWLSSQVNPISYCVRDLDNGSFLYDYLCSLVNHHMNSGAVVITKPMFPGTKTNGAGCAWHDDCPRVFCILVLSCHF